MSDPEPASAEVAAPVRLLRNLVIGVSLFAAGGLAVVLSAGDDGGGDVAAGPEPAADVDEYVSARHDELAGAAGTHEAVVSFTSYLDEREAAGVVDRPVAGWLVAAPGGPPMVTDDVERWRDEQAAAAREEMAALEALLPTVEDPEFERQYRHDRDRQERMAEALARGEPVAFGVVTRAPAEHLRALAGSRRVRLVDIVPAGAAGPPRGLRPEERVVVGQPPTRP